MRDRPGGAELLRQAREVLLEELLASLPPDKRYDGLMVAAAMATAARELEAGEAPLRRAYAGLAGLYGEAAPAAADAAALEDSLLRLTSRLADEIRRGEHDADRRVHALLTEAVADRLRESNPEVLEAARDEPRAD